MVRALGLEPYDGLVRFLLSAGARVHGAPYDFRTILDPAVFDRYVEDLGALIDGCDRDPVLVTHSMGGVVAAAALAERARRLSAESALLDRSGVRPPEPRSSRNPAAVVDVCPAYGGSWSAYASLSRGAAYLPLDARLRPRAALTARRTACFVLSLPNPLAFREPWIPGDEGHRGLTSGAWRRAAAPMLSEVQAFLRPRGAGRERESGAYADHTIVYCNTVPTPAGPGAGDTRGGDGVLLPEASLCMATGDTRVVRVAGKHRTAASCSAVARLVLARAAA